jgi:hypothetical protein
MKQKSQPNMSQMFSSKCIWFCTAILATCSMKQKYWSQQVLVLMNCLRGQTWRAIKQFTPEHMFAFGIVISLLTACLEYYDGWCGGLAGQEVVMVSEEAQQLATQYCNTVRDLRSDLCGWHVKFMTGENVWSPAVITQCNTRTEQ